MKLLSLLVVPIMIMSLSTPCLSLNDYNTDTESLSDTVNVYYFHNTRRCNTCQAVEDITKQTLEETYPEEMKNGSMIFQSLNIEEDTNEAIARKLRVSGQALLVVKNGKKKDLTNTAFMYAKSNPEKLKEKIIATITKL